MTGGHWCGYVGIPKEHKYHGKSHGDCDDIEAPGGITYGYECDGKPGVGVCHHSDSEEDDVWWLGFDCAHCWDYQPASEAFCGKTAPYYENHKDRLNYKTLVFVQNECNKLAKQLKDMEC